MDLQDFRWVLLVFIVLQISQAEERVQDYMYLGTRNTDGLDDEHHFYYASSTSGIWNTTIEDCKKTFGESAHLLSIESEQEQLTVNAWLENRGSGGASFWTSGAYNPIKLDWEWNEDFCNDINYTNWGLEEPQNINEKQRIILNHQNQFTAFWESVDDTVLMRYICEIPEE